MALIPRGLGNNCFEPFFGTRISDPFERFSVFDHFLPSIPSFPKDVSSVACTRVDWVETPESHIFTADLPAKNLKSFTQKVTCSTLCALY
ncbi:hypothetical protein Mapa_011240 [Marchantia paleacea]|nr:hypothetical protein Mapa_011240 [Marchantia paleacea]